MPSKDGATDPPFPSRLASARRGGHGPGRRVPLLGDFWTSPSHYVAARLAARELEYGFFRLVNAAVLRSCQKKNILDLGRIRSTRRTWQSPSQPIPTSEQRNTTRDLQDAALRDGLLHTKRVPEVPILGPGSLPHAVGLREAWNRELRSTRWLRKRRSFTWRPWGACSKDKHAGKPATRIWKEYLFVLKPSTRTLREGPIPRTVDFVSRARGRRARGVWGGAKL